MDIRKFTGVIAGMAMLVLSWSPVQAAVVVYDGGTGYAISIQNLDVGGTKYNVTFMGGSYDSVFASDSPTFFGDDVGADAAADAIMAAMNTEPSVPEISSYGPELLWVPYAYSGSTNFLTTQVGHDLSSDPWQRYADFVGSRSTDFSQTYGWYFAKFTDVPEPPTYLLMGLGLLALISFGRRNRTA